MKTSIVSALAAAPALALAQMTMDVDVGKTGLVFEPDSITAEMGTVINFHFYNPGSHSVAQSTYMSPCVPSGDDAIWSGYFDQPPSGESSMMFQVTVNSTDPIWLYCATGDHCEEGMAMVINPPSSGMTLSEYVMNAANVPQASAPPTVQGGVVVGGSSGGSGSMTSSSGAMMSTSSMMMSGSMTSSSGPMMSSTSSMMMGGSMTSSAAAMETTGAAANVQAQGVFGAAAFGLLGALLA